MPKPCRCCLWAMLLPLLLAVTQIAPVRAESMALESKRISLQVKDVALRDALHQLTEQAGVRFVYNDALVKGVIVSCSCQDVTVKQALTTLLQNTALTFLVRDDSQIVLIRRKTVEKRNIKGHILDAATHEALPNATVLLKGTNSGTISNTDGYFVLVNVPAVTCTLSVRYIGFIPQEVVVTGKATDESLTILMRAKAIDVKGMTVVGEDLQMLDVPKEPSQVKFSPRQLSTLPSIGEVDIFRSLQLLPGISGVNNGSGLYVRGGTPDQNLVLLDGMTVYHVDHFFGFFSAFNSDLYRSRSQDSRNLNEPLTNMKNGLGIFSAFSSQSVDFYVKKE